MERPQEQREGIDIKASICTRDGVRLGYPILILHPKKIYGCNGDIQERDIRTQQVERNSKIYNMSIF